MAENGDDGKNPPGNVVDITAPQTKAIPAKKGQKPLKGARPDEMSNMHPSPSELSVREKAVNYQYLKGKMREDGIKPPGYRWGRPSKYDPIFIELMEEFFNIPVDRGEEVDAVDNEGNSFTKVIRVVNRFPTLSRFALIIGITRETMYAWAHEVDEDGELRYPDFSHAYMRAKDAQDAIMTEGGMGGAYEARFSTLAAKNIIGWKDKVESTGETKIVDAVDWAALEARFEQAMALAEERRQSVISRNRDS